MVRPLSNVIGVDDAPFAHGWRGDVTLVGAVFARERLDGVVLGKARRDGRNGTERIARMIHDSAFHRGLQAVLLSGITVAGFNVVDIHALAAAVGRPVIAVLRRRPRMSAIRRALEERVPGGHQKLAVIERAGPIAPAGPVFVQVSGAELDTVRRSLEVLTVHGALPEPLRVAHLIAGAIALGRSRGRA